MPATEPGFLVLVMMTSFLSLSLQRNFADYRVRTPRVKGFFAPSPTGAAEGAPRRRP
jgi:hypothetical protein